MKALMKGSKKWPALARKKRDSSMESISSATADGNTVDNDRRVSLETLPYELLERILTHLILDNERTPKDLYSSLYALSAVSKSLRRHLPNSLLYSTVVLFTKKQALKFYKIISKSKYGEVNCQYVKSVCFVQPKNDTGAGIELDNTGYSYTGSSSNTNETSWPDLVMDIVSRLPNLEEVIFDEIGPRFTFHTSVDGSREYNVMKNREQPLSVYIAPESGWHTNLKANTLWPLGSIKKLQLSSIIIDDESLSKRNEGSIKELILSGCWIRSSPNNLVTYFSNVESLVLDNLRDEGEILWIHCFPKLKSLTLKLVGRIHNRKPKSELLYPIGLLPPSEAHRAKKDYSNIGVRDSIELQNMGKIIHNIVAPVRTLKTLAISIPSICMVPPDRESFKPEIDIYRHLGSLSHLESLTLIIACLPGTESELPRNDLEWEQNLPENLLKAPQLELVIKYYNSEVVYQKRVENM